jgi:hypothetical protein
MSSKKPIHTTLKWMAGVLGLATGTYATYVGVAWYRYGRAAQPGHGDEHDDLLDRFMPAYEVGGRHHVRVAAPAAITLAAAREMDLLQSPVARVIFRGRELILGATPADQARPHGLLAEMKALGWGMLAEIPDREIVVGAVTQPWKANVVFRSLPPSEFAAFDEPGYVKIVWTLRADPIGPSASVFRTETRVTTTDMSARKKFRWYWSFFSPGMFLIRWVSLSPLKADAERRAAAASKLEVVDSKRTDGRVVDDARLESVAL